MIHIKKFIDKISYLDTKNIKDVIINIHDAKGLRDEIAKLLLDLNELQTNKSSNSQDVITLEVKGGTFK